MQFGQWVGFAFWRDGGCADCHNLSKLNNSCNKDLRGRGGGGGGAIECTPVQVFGQLGSPSTQCMI